MAMHMGRKCGANQCVHLWCGIFDRNWVTAFDGIAIVLQRDQRGRIDGSWLWRVISVLV